MFMFSLVSSPYELSNLSQQIKEWKEIINHGGRLGPVNTATTAEFAVFGSIDIFLPFGLFFTA